MEESNDKGPEVDPVVGVPEEKPEPKAPVVTLTYHVNDDVKRGAVIPGIPSDIKVTIETYNEAYTKRVQTLKEFEDGYRKDHPEAPEEEIQRAGSDHILAHISLLESIIAVNRLEWVMDWRVFEDRLKIASDAERTRLRKSDAERRRSNVEGPAPVRVSKPKRITHVPASPAERQEMAIMLLMRNLKLTREEAMDRLRMTQAIASVEAPSEPVIPGVTLDEEPIE